MEGCGEMDRQHSTHAHARTSRPPLLPHLIHLTPLTSFRKTKPLFITLPVPVQNPLLPAPPMSMPPWPWSMPPMSMSGSIASFGDGEEGG